MVCPTNAIRLKTPNLPLTLKEIYNYLKQSFHNFK